MNRTTLTDAYCVNAFRREIAYLKKFDVDRLVAGFRRNAGLPAPGRPYGGWESSLIAGHFVGHYLTAVAQAYAGTGDAELLAISDQLVDAISAVQADDGFLFAATGDVAGRTQFDNVERGLTDIFTQAWVPWYTMHKLISGLIDTYKFLGNRKALAAAARLGTWVFGRTAAWSETTRAAVLGVEYGGMNDCLYELYKITRQREHAIAAHAFDEVGLFDEIHKGHDVLDGKHANTMIPKFSGAFNRYRAWRESGDDAFEFAGDERDIGFYREAAERFWDLVVNGHSYATGGNSDDEHFGPPGHLDGERTNVNCETCNTYNMLKLTRELFALTHDRKYADYYENAFINSILSSQNPETGMTTYFQPMATGYFKVYSSEFDHFWCCTGTGTENFTKLADSLYFAEGETVFVNMYFGSIFRWDEKAVAIMQESVIPEGDTATFTVRGSARFDLRLRIPDWTADHPEFRLNGEPLSPRLHAGCATIERQWSDGDVLAIKFPMKVVARRLPDGDAWSFKYGPVVLSAALGSENLTTEPHGVGVLKSAPIGKVDDTIRIPEAYGSVAAWIAKIDTNFERLPGPLAFALRNADREFTFIPHFKQHTERYGIYWYLSFVSDD